MSTSLSAQYLLMSNLLFGDIELNVTLTSLGFYINVIPTDLKQGVAAPLIPQPVVSQSLTLTFMKPRRQFSELM